MTSSWVSPWLHPSARDYPPALWRGQIRSIEFDHLHLVDIFGVLEKYVLHIALQYEQHQNLNQTGDLWVVYCDEFGKKGQRFKSFALYCPFSHLQHGWGQLRSWSWSWVQLQLRSWSWNWSWNLRSWSWSWSWYSRDLPELELELELPELELELELKLSGVGVGIGVEILSIFFIYTCAYIFRYYLKHITLKLCPSYYAY